MSTPLSTEQQHAIIQDQITDWEAQKFRLQLQVEGAIAAGGANAPLSSLHNQIKGFDKAIAKIRELLAPPVEATDPPL